MKQRVGVGVCFSSVCTRYQLLAAAASVSSLGLADLDATPPVGVSVQTQGLAGYVWGMERRRGVRTKSGRRSAGAFTPGAGLPPSDVLIPRRHGSDARSRAPTPIYTSTTPRLLSLFFQSTATCAH